MSHSPGRHNLNLSRRSPTARLAADKSGVPRHDARHIHDVVDQISLDAGVAFEHLQPARRAFRTKIVRSHATVQPNVTLSWVLERIYMRAENGYVG
jgi:hypothetical protein